MKKKTVIRCNECLNVLIDQCHARNGTSFFDNFEGHNMDCPFLSCKAGLNEYGGYYTKEDKKEDTSL